MTFNSITLKYLSESTLINSVGCKCCPEIINVRTKTPFFENGHSIRSKYLEFYD